MGCCASKSSRGREDYSTLRADSSPNIPLVSAVSEIPNARELLVIPDNTSRSSVLQNCTLPKQALPSESSTPSHSIDPSQSIVTRESPIRPLPSSLKTTTNNSKSSTSNTKKEQTHLVETSPNPPQQRDIHFLPNITRDTKPRTTHAPPPRHQEDKGLEAVEAPRRKASRSVDSRAVQSVVSTVATPSVNVPPPTTTTPHTNSEVAVAKKHHKKKKKKRASKTKENKETRDASDKVAKSTSAKETHTPSIPKEQRSSTTREATHAPKQPPSFQKPTTSREARASKFKPRLSQKAFSMFSLETPQPCSKSGMKFDELYKLKGVLGTGAFSTVREGQHRTSTEITYAVKCVNRKKLSPEDEAALLDEVAILKEMKHPHIIRLYDFFVSPHTYYLVMERMSGGELFDRIVAKAYYNEKEARDVCKILIQAVGYCHFNNVAHRDLKPENLLLLADDDDSAVKIADFGFAKKCEVPNSLKTQCGTPGYVAPEILDGIPYDTKCDMWSVGVILYILLGGYPPFIENNQRELFKKIRKGDYEFHPEYWHNVSKEAKQLISALLTVDPSKRLNAEEALDNQWIREDDKDLEKKDLGPNLAELKKFNAKRKFKAAVYGVMASNKLQSLGQDFQKNLS